MDAYISLFFQSFVDYWNYLSDAVTQPELHNFFYALIGISLFFYSLELLMPWRKNQPKIRKDFWLDGFYMFFNFFIFSLIGYYAVSNVFSKAFNDFLSLFGIHNLVAIQIQSFPVWGQWLTLFLLRDFIHWNIHRLLHRSSFLWEFHKVHHSVEQMGFAAHLRYHWMETVVYRTLEYIPLGMIGFGIQDFYIVHIFAISVGHFNHSNISIPLGPLKYIFNNPQMHIWHHAKTIPDPNGVNFGLTLSIWDYLFKTSWIPKDGRDEALGFDNVESFPSTFIKQELYPFVK
ncbi:sterol desaturase family protein [bacterium]|nr:MAG: sterol desaturase family protein [bacterium]